MEQGACQSPMGVQALLGVPRAGRDGGGAAPMIKRHGKVGPDQRIVRPIASLKRVASSPMRVHKASASRYALRTASAP